MLVGRKPRYVGSMVEKVPGPEVIISISNFVHLLIENIEKKNWDDEPISFLFNRTNFYFLVKVWYCDNGSA